MFVVTLCRWFDANQKGLGAMKLAKAQFYNKIRTTFAEDFKNDVIKEGKKDGQDVFRGIRPKGGRPAQYEQKNAADVMMGAARGQARQASGNSSSSSSSSVLQPHFPSTGDHIDIPDLSHLGWGPLLPDPDDPH